MKCHNPDCNSVRAIEVNISINTSDCWAGETIDYTGDTDYGDHSPAIGTYCYDCRATSLLNNYRNIVMNHIDEHFISKARLAG